MSDWISVKDGLPDVKKDTDFLTWNGKHILTLTWEPAWQSFEFGHMSITHWMPLPAPPEGVEA